MIENRELAHEMALAEDPYREVEILARKVGLNALSPVILKFANRATKQIESKWKQDAQAEIVAEKHAARDAVIDDMSPDYKRPFLDEGDFKESLVSLGYSKHMAGATWNKIHWNAWSVKNAASRPNMYPKLDYPLTFAEVPLPDYSRYTKKVNILEVVMLQDALSNNRQDMRDGTYKHLSLTENALDMLDELVRLHQPSE